jgi:tetratricopeptide (TPR) repeat protein
VSQLTNFLRASVLCLLLFGGVSSLARATTLQVPAGTSATIDKIYSFDLDGAIEDAQRLQQENPKHPLGYLLEAEAMWWKIWCTSAEYKYGMNDARHRAKLDADQHYLELATKISTLAEQQNKRQETAEMTFYAGMGDALAARLYGLRWETRNTARAGVRGREHFLRAIALDPQLADADLGLGLYNYYVDTLSTMARMLRFFMGIPGGSKQEGIRLLERDIARGVLTSSVARFYLALNLHRYDQQYEKALAVIGPLADQYPSNPLFQLARGDLYGKLRRKEKAVACYRKAGQLPVHDRECREHIRKLAAESLAAQGASESPKGADEAK